MTDKVVLICGGRKFCDSQYLFNVMDAAVRGGLKIDLVVTGGQRGADTMAVVWAKARNIRHKEVIANFHAFGRAAGPIRNTKMLDEYQPYRVIAFPGNKGTADMIRQASERGIQVDIIKEPKHAIRPLERSRDQNGIGAVRDSDQTLAPQRERSTGGFDPIHR
jgi:hypothetical protein